MEIVAGNCVALSSRKMSQICTNNTTKTLDLSVWSIIHCIVKRNYSGNSRSHTALLLLHSFDMTSLELSTPLYDPLSNCEARLT